MQFREITGLWSARVPDGPDSDQYPDTVPLEGHVTFEPEYRVPLVYPGEHIVVEPMHAVIHEGVLYGETVVGDDVVRGSLFLPVTVDDAANQTWAWIAKFQGMRLGEYGEEVTLPNVRFQVPAGDDALDLSAVIPASQSGGTITLRGPAGPGLTSITAEDGEIVFSWDNGRSTTIDVPETVPGPKGEPGAVGARGPEGPPGSVELTGVVPEITVGANSLNVGGRDALLLTHYAPYVRGSLAADVDLNSMTSLSDNGFWTIGSANSNPNLPATPGVPGKLSVENAGFDRKQTVTFRFGGGVYERDGSGATWRSWQRVDSAFAPQGPLASGTSLSAMRTRASTGVWNLNPASDYTDLPELSGARQPGALYVFTTGLGDTIQLASFRFNQGAFWRVEASVGTFTDWEPLGGANTTDMELAITGMQDTITGLQTALTAARMGTPPSTTFEQTAVFTSYQHGEAYMDWVAEQFPTRVSILDLGESRLGLPIRAFQMGDPTKPTMYVMASQHGDEPMGREAAYLWVRELCQDSTFALQNFFQEACLVVAPVVNADRINVSRLTSSQTDLNRNWVTRTAKETQAAASVFATHDVVLMVDAHEGGKYTHMQGVGPTAEGVAQSVLDQSAALHAHLTASFGSSSYPWDDYPGGADAEVARNAIALQEGCATYLFESPSLLSENMYSPTVTWRRDMYLHAYRAAFDHFRTNLDDYVGAKASASA